MPKSMFDIFSGSLNGKARSCPECESPMESNGCCSECGYGEEEDMEEEDDSEEEDMRNDRMIELCDDLQRIVDKMRKMTTDKEEPMPQEVMLPTVFTVSKVISK